MRIFDSIRKARALLDNKIVSGVIICGDFNLPNIKWDENLIRNTDTHRLDSVEAEMLKKQDESLFTQHVNFPTFLKSDGSVVNTLDYVITETNERIAEIRPKATLGTLSQGHIVLEWSYTLINPDKDLGIGQRIRNYNKANVLEINKGFSRIR